MRSIFVLSLVLLGVVPAHADDGPAGRSFYDTGELYDMCTGTDPKRQDICFGYIAAVADSVTYYGHAEHRCIADIPLELHISETRDRVLEGMRQHPEIRQYAAFAQTLFAIQHFFPCKD